MTTKRKEIQVTDSTTVALVSFDDSNNKVSMIDFIFEGDSVAKLVLSTQETRVRESLYQLVDECAEADASSFVMDVITQKEMLSSLKGLKKVRKDLDVTNQSILGVFLLNFDLN